jgi:hypothetical protein
LLLLRHMEYYPKAEKFVVDAFTKANSIKSIKHFERTVYWLTELKPNADEALQIAAFAHDIERAFRDKVMDTIFEKSSQGFRDEEYLERHQTKGAEIVANFLTEQNAPNELAERVKMLISKHEVGGNDDQNLLKDADSISYFENQVNHFISTKAKEVGKEKVQQKFQWMFNRITSKQAKEIVKPMFEEAIKKLNE